jgi:Recombinase zinc beta ribbon domain
MGNFCFEATLSYRRLERPRPVEEWTEIPVPAIISEDTFQRVAARLADNKRFASRNSKVASLLQGLAACSGCGYGYYRTSTRTTTKKIYYYRCLGSDDYRYQGGRVCDNKPVRADHLDQVVWEHTTGLLADPHLIRAEIDKRLHSARTADPAVKQRERLDLALAKATKAITNMIEAFQEQLLTIDELRTRMPDLRARETSLRGQIEALDAQLADRELYLKLADNLEGFLTQLRDTAEVSRVEDRQRVLRLLVKDVLIGPEKITIRHRIPVRDSTNAALPDYEAEPDADSDHSPSYPLRWGRERRTLRGTRLHLRDDPALERPRPQPTSEQLDHPSVPHAPLHLSDQRVVVDGVEARLDVGVEHPCLALIGRHTDSLQGLLGGAFRAEPETDRAEVGLEDRLEHDLGGRHHHPVAHRRDTQRPGLTRPTRLGDVNAPQRLRPIRSRPHPFGEPVEEGPHRLHAPSRDVVDANTVDSGVASVRGHVRPRSPHHVAAGDLVEQGMEPTSVRRRSRRSGSGLSMWRSSWVVGAPRRLARTRC